jgi:hypothetical protein
MTVLLLCFFFFANVIDSLKLIQSTTLLTSQFSPTQMSPPFPAPAADSGACTEAEFSARVIRVERLTARFTAPRPRSPRNCCIAALRSPR